MDHSLGLLVGGGRDVPDRQRTLRATIAWSYDLLSEAARRLFAVCSVFRGGINLDILETVCAEALDLGVPILDPLAELVDQSLLSQASVSTTVPRYTMLETVREFAAEQLAGCPKPPMSMHRTDRRSGASPMILIVLRAGPRRRGWTISSSSTTTFARP